MGCSESTPAIEDDVEYIDNPMRQSSPPTETETEPHILDEKEILRCGKCLKNFYRKELGRSSAGSIATHICFDCLQACWKVNTKCLSCGEHSVRDPEYGCMCTLGHVVCRACYQKMPDRRWCDEFGPRHMVWKRYIGILQQAAETMALKANDIPSW